MGKKLKSIAHKGDYPLMYVPQPLMTPLLRKRFWYVPITEVIAKAWYWLATPYHRLMGKLEGDAEKFMAENRTYTNEAGEEIKIDAPEGVDVNLVLPGERNNE